MTPDDLKAWRQKHGLTQSDAARALGLTLTKDGTTSDAVRHYERGSRAIPETVARLCRYVDRYGVLD